MEKCKPLIDSMKPYKKHDNVTHPESCNDHSVITFKNYIAIEIAGVQKSLFLEHISVILIQDIILAKHAMH